MTLFATRLAAIFSCSLLIGLQGTSPQTTQNPPPPETPLPPPKLQPTQNPQPSSTPDAHPQASSAETPNAAPKAPTHSPTQASIAPLHTNPPASILEDATIEPDPFITGQQVSLYWPPGAAKVLISGGRFGKHTDLSGWHTTADTPRQTTIYRIQAWYPNKSPNAAKSQHSPALLQKQFTLTAQAYSGKFPALTTYHDPHGWRIDYLKGWHIDASPLDDPANNALVYFQPQEDSPERIAVAILPVKVKTSAALLQQAMYDVPTQYDVIQDVRQKETDQCGLPATWMSFHGVAQALPGTPTTSMVLTFVKDGRGYVISARVRNGDYNAHWRLLRSLMRSFAFEPISEVKPPPTP